MSWGTITVGRLALREDYTITATAGQSLTIKGQESSPPLTAAQLEQRREDLLGLAGEFLPVTFTSKARLNGFYRVDSVKADYTNFQDATVLTLDWTLDLDRYGTEFEVDLESRLSGPLTRNTSFSVTGERWLAPPAGHYGFWAGSTVPSVVTRTGVDGATAVYRNVPLTGAGYNPRWGAVPASALAGRVRFLDATATERSGLNFTAAPTGWELNNALVRVKPLTAGGVLEVSAWTGGAWQTKAWDVLSGGVSLGTPSSVTVLRNNLENVLVRVLWASAAAPGRTTMDLTLRRGSRFVEVYLKATASTTLKVVRPVVEAGSSGTGYVRATANDAATNRYIIGSAQAFTNDLVNGGLSKAATTTLDVFIGVAVAGSGAVAGDQPDNLMAQYLGSPNELVVPVRR
jgi:hypothetical protein